VALPVDQTGNVLSLLDRADGVEDELDLGYEDQLQEDEEGRPKRRRVSTKHKSSYEELTGYIDEIVPVLEKDFKSRTQELKVALANFKSKQRDMEMAKKEATQAMKALRQEAEKRRRAASDRKKAKENERKAKDEAIRTAKEAMIKKAQALMGAKGQSENAMLSDVALGTMINVLMALPAAVENPIFTKRLNRAKDQAVNTVQDFLNITRRKTSKFVLAASKASDVELSFLLARYFHEASFRTKAMQSDGEKIARDLNVVMPRELRLAFLPIIKGIRAQAMPLRVNASSLAEATITDACTQMSGLMANISDYNNKLNTMHSSMHDVWQISELILPKVGKIYPMKPIVIDTVKDFMSMATSQVAGLQEAADEIVVNVGPIVAERMQCTWSAAIPRSRTGWAALLAALGGYLFA